MAAKTAAGAALLRAPLVTLDEIRHAHKVINDSPHVRRTTLATEFNIPGKHGAQETLLKLENTQNTGSFKIRGMTNAFSNAGSPSQAVTMSAGNAGKSFSYLAKQTGVKGTVVMPHGVPQDRIKMIEANGATVVQADLSELQSVVDGYVGKGSFYCHPFDSKDLIAGHASCALEILEDCPDVDVIVVCCGGGGLVSGCAAGVKLSRHKARVIAVEPEGAPSMYLSVKEGKALALDNKYTTIAHGLRAPFAGPISFEHVKEFVDDVVLVSDDELRQATKLMYEWGFIAETSGCAAVAAVMAGKISGIEGKKVACVVSGSNIKPDELLEEVFNTTE
jgi:threonine dehydratase